MNRFSLIIVALVSITLLTTANQQAAAAPKPIWDLDYELYVGIPTTHYQMWIKPAGGDWYLYTTYKTESEYNNGLFFLIEHNVFPNAEFFKQPVAAINWYYWMTYETWAEATAAADDWNTLGFQTDIKSVFGGYLIDDIISASGLSASQFRRYTGN